MISRRLARGMAGVGELKSHAGRELKRRERASEQLAAVRGVVKLGLVKKKMLEEDKPIPNQGQTFLANGR